MHGPYLKRTQLLCVICIVCEQAVLVYHGTVAMHAYNMSRLRSRLPSSIQDKGAFIVVSRCGLCESVMPSYHNKATQRNPQKHR